MTIPVYHRPTFHFTAKSATMVKTGSSKGEKQTPTSEDSTSLIPSFPQEIIAEILSKLPVKSLLRLRCVSKSWLALISSPEFVKTHLHSSANDKEYNNHKIILRWDSHLRDCSLPSLLFNQITESSEMDYPMRNFDIRWCYSVNGLICLAGTKKIYKPIMIPEHGVSLCIWNPSLRNCKILPEVKLMPIFYTSFRYGFGYDELHDEYKIVVIFKVFNDTKVKIYSLKTDCSWRTIRDFQGSSWINGSAKYVKGKLYWTSLSAHENNDYNISCNIVSFDLANETWDNVEQPDYGEGKFDLKLGVLGSDLVALCNYERHHSDVWVMNNYGVEPSWKKILTISCLPDPRNYTFFTHSSMSFSPIFCESYKGEFLMLFHSVFLIYNPKEDSIRQVEVAELMGWFEAEIFVESLVNPFVEANED